MPMFRQLTQRDPTLATEERFEDNLVDRAAINAQGHYPQPFIDAYLDLITANGADMTAADEGWRTPLYWAANWGSPKVADYLCRKLPSDQIDPRDDGETPLAWAARSLDWRTQELQHPNTPEPAESDEYKLIMRILLRAGADISSIPTDTDEDRRRRRRRQLVLTEHATVLNQLGLAVMAAVNAALAPHRQLAALLTPRLAVGPEEAPIFGWRIASYLFDIAVAKEAIGEAIGVRHSDMARRVCAAAEHFIHSAVYQASSNREVVGGTANVGGQVVRVPQLQCFVVGGVGGRKMELREVVQRAILDEAAKWGLAGEIDNGFSKDVPAATKELTLGIIGRTITSPQQVTRLIQQNADIRLDADPNVIFRLRRKGRGCSGIGYLLLCLAIDDKSGYTVETIQADDDEGPFCRPVALPQWSSDELQRAVLTALYDGGADPNVAADETGETWETPLRVAIAYGNQTAFDILTARQGIDMRPPDALMVMELPDLLRPPPTEYLRLLISMFRQLITRDPTLATEERNGYNENLVHLAAEVVHYPQSFIDSYLDLVTANGADMTADDRFGQTPLHLAAAWYGSLHVADYLCRKLPAAQINRWDNSGRTPLSWAAKELDWRIQRLQDPNTPEADKERYRTEIPNLKLIIRTLLRTGADISSIPTATEKGRHQRQLALTEYATVLNELPTAVMAAVNAALAPHRSLAALLTPRLAVGPQEAPIFGWRIASYLFDIAVAKEAIGEAIGVRHSDMARRVCAAAEHFIHSAVYQASSNREVVGGTANVGGQVVRVPQLQCFVVGGVGGRKMELREVVQRAILDEAAKWGLAGEIDNGFSKDVPAVAWGAVGWVDKGRDGRETFRRLGMT
ncbi:unnamed protein product [Vitrella brassicaformis CCMP3155]|uniref:Uncharacterized protein n=1 Tax=Vitrella brassicaformis (strain CCMP3155) TaxID=1169540 RepID=A0A0G4EDW3_VITBC|nr:unnamed protein product [Vitrella brassicaformis CCMP3155]|eukprot:CEL93934.1 unnamed protein product [Vitrella brassicaformis CCMP3155]